MPTRILIRWKSAPSGMRSKGKRKLPALLLCLLAGLFCSGQGRSLNDGWQFRRAGTNTWYPASVPGTVHTDLLRNKLIPDPFYRDNEDKVQWVEKSEWEYQCRFRLLPAQLRQDRIRLSFEGLDTEADVFLNGKLLFRADNMFRTWTAEIKGLAGVDNRLLVRFRSSSETGARRKKAFAFPVPENERVFVRKAQYHFGWDWGPRLVTCGIWKNVWISAFSGAELTRAYIPVQRYELERKADSEGESFRLLVEGKPVYIRGANWIPLDNFLPRAVRLDRYRERILQAREAGINLLRVWGGGVYEDDQFYRICDSVGIMVWQDFMFAGALYPADPAFLRNVEAEVTEQVRRLRNYKCIALWCGNNEIEEAWFNWGWQKQFGWSAADSLQLWKDYRKLFHELIPRILQQEDPHRPYWPSSPSLGWGRDSAYRKGDVHYWGVWWGKEPVEAYNRKVGRLNSEYGMQGMPPMQTIRQFTLPSDLDTASRVMELHQKHPFGWENIGRYIRNRFREPRNFSDLVYVSQLMQADAIRVAIEAHRRAKPYNMGTMFWQWNDCWPVTSWSAVDYYGRKKALFYEVKRSYRDLVILPSFDSLNYYFRIVSELPDTLSLNVETDFLSFRNAQKNTLKANGTITMYPNSSFGGRSTRDSTKEFPKDGCMRFRLVQRGKTVGENYLFLLPPRDLDLPKAQIRFQIRNGMLELESDAFAYGVFIETPDGVELEDNFFHLPAGEKKRIRIFTKLPVNDLQQKINVRSLSDTHLP